MTCTTCHAVLPENALACAACIASSNYHQLLKAQQSFLPAVVSGKLDLRTGRLTNGVRHLYLYTAKDQTYCGIVFAHSKRSLCSYDEIANRAYGVCTECWAKLSAIVAELEHRT